MNVDRDTPMMLPPDLRDWVAKDDIVHFVIDAVELLDLREFNSTSPIIGVSHSLKRTWGGLLSLPIFRVNNRRSRGLPDNPSFV